MKDADRASLIGFLEAMDGAAEGRQTICVIGAAALILLTQPERQTGDIDVWRRDITAKLNARIEKQMAKHLPARRLQQALARKGVLSCVLMCPESGRPCPCFT